MSECKANWFRACKFQPRYDESAGSLPDADSYAIFDAAKVLQASKAKTYIRDVCERCGKTIERTDMETSTSGNNKNNDA